MSENLKVSIKTEAATADFVLTFDPAFMADRHMQVVIRRDGACEPEVVHLMARVIKSGDVVIDGGANVGFFTCYMASLVGRTGLVYAVEPAPANLFKLGINIANNSFKNVRVVKSALWNDISEQTVHLASDSGLNSLVQGPETIGQMKMVTTTIDAVLDGQEAKLIKLDLEGAEGQALRGAEEALKTCPYVVCEMHEEALQRFYSNRETVRMFMAERGFATFYLHKEGTIPLLLPRLIKINSKRQNLMLLFSTIENVAKAWPSVEIA